MRPLRSIRRLTLVLSLLVCLLWTSAALALDRYWVGGTGSWNTSSTTHWSATSGGSSGASAPGTGDNAIFDANSSNADYTVTPTTTAPSVGNLTLANPTGGVLTMGGATAISVYGNLSVSAGVLWTHAGTLTFKATDTGHTITTNGVSIGSNMVFSGTGGGWTLQDALTCTDASGIVLTHGSLDTGGFAISSTGFDSTNTNTRTLTLGATVWTLTGSTPWAVTATNLTFSGASSSIKMTHSGTGDKTFGGGGLTYGDVWFALGNTGGARITGSNTFNSLRVDSPPRALKCTASTTQTIGTLTASGTSGNLMTLDTISGSGTFTLAKSGGGTVSLDYLSVTRSVASPASTFYAGTHSTDGGSNSGWTFTAPPTNGSMFLLFSRLFQGLGPRAGVLF